MKTALFKLRHLVLILALIFTACGEEGPQGPEGPQGEQGPQGEIGPAGEDGSMILAGSGAPASDDGSTGDYYLDKGTGDLYGPKMDDGSWGSPISLNGSDGEDGSQIFSGTTSPDNSLGQEGDYFLNTDTYDLYGPKTSGEWGTPINLKGTTDVRYTDWFNFEDETSRTDFFFYQDLDYGFLSDEYIENGGSVLVYIGYVPDHGLDEDPIHPSTIFLLPQEDYNGSNEWETNFRFNTGPTSGSVDITIDVTNTTASTREEFLKDIYYVDNRFLRIIFIPGGTSVRTASPDIDLNNYKEVKRYYGIN